MRVLLPVSPSSARPDPAVWSRTLAVSAGLDIGPVSAGRVRLAAGARASTDAPLDLDLPGPNGEGIPLSAVGRATLVPSESAIHRRGGERVNLIRGFVAPRVLPGEALAALRSRLDAIPDLLPQVSSYADAMPAS